MKRDLLSSTMSDTLFPDLSTRERAATENDGAPRVETANREQIELTPTDLETLLPPGHAARLVWRFVEGLDLSAFYAAVRAREGRPGRAAIDPKILVALWLYATIDGVGSAREVDRLCYAHDAYRWLRGGVSVNYHTLSDFRVGHREALDALLTQSITVLLDKQVVTLNRIAQDGMKVRANAGVRSFRRGQRLADCQQMARQQVKRTFAQMDGELSARRAAAQQRAAEEQLARVDEALAQLPTIAAAKKRNGSKSEPKASTTDPDARVMKMADGGFRPAYNVQFASDVDGQAVVGVAVTNGGEQAQLVPMLQQVERRTGRKPQAVFADGGFVSTEGVVGVAQRGVTLYAPVADGKHAPGSGQGPVPPAVAEWRARMATPEAQTVYRVRAATAERLNADTRVHRGLNAVPVRGLSKVHSWALWAALAFNLLRVMEIVPHQMM
jgi:transposase